MRRFSLPRLGLLVTGAALATLFPLGGVSGQPGRPPINRPGLQPRMFETIWKCGKCGHVLARGPIKPTVASCPSCGVHFRNGGVGFNPFEQNAPDAGNAGNPQPPAGNAGNNPAMPFNPGGQGAPPANAGNNPPMPFNPGGQPAPPAAAAQAPPAANAQGSSGMSTGMILLMIGIFVGGAVIIGGIILVVVLASRSGPKKSAKKKKRRVVERDDEDEDDRSRDDADEDEPVRAKPKRKPVRAVRRGD
jgi:hypothetical protein